MLRDILTTVRPREDLLLGNGKTDDRISGQIVQYLWPHQLVAVRKVYENYKNCSATILNDSDRSGKRFLCIAFFNAILRSSNHKRILILCNDKTNLDKWHFLIEALLNIPIVRLNNQNPIDAIEVNTAAKVLLSTVDDAVDNVHFLMQHTFECMVIQDPHLELITSTYDQLIKITTKCKIYITGTDPTIRLANLYDLLKFCNHKSLLSVPNEPDTIITKGEFLSKFSFSNATKKKDKILVSHQLQATNAYSNLIIRHSDDAIHQIPAVDTESFQMAFNTWRTSNNLAPIESDVVSVDTTPIQSTPDEKKDNDESESTLHEQNTANNYETQMSPLLYDNTDSDIEADVPNALNENIPCSQAGSSTCSTLIPCSQESSSSTTEEAIYATQGKFCATSKGTHKKVDKDRSFGSSASKRLKYKTLNIRTNSKNVTRRSRRESSRSTSAEWPSLIGRSQRIVRTPSVNIVSSSDVQIISDKLASPITVTGSSCETVRAARTSIGQEALCPELLCMSPDLFTSYESIRNRNEPVADTLDSESDTEQQPFDLALSTSLNNDIFEITRNNVFGSVLCSAADRITPVKEPNDPMPKNDGSGPCCLTGIRVLIPAISDADKQIEQSTTCHFDEAITSTQNSVVIVGSQEVDDVVVISSEESACAVASIELTPKNRKLELTPSTRSCLKRRSNGADENEAESSSKQPKWLSTKQSKHGSTPESRRRLQRWLNRTSPDQSTGQSPRSSRPRNLLNESFGMMGCRATRPINFNMNSPNVFSDDEL